MKDSFTCETFSLLWMLCMLMAYQTMASSMVNVMLPVAKEIQCVRVPIVILIISSGRKHTCDICCVSVTGNVEPWCCFCSRHSEYLVEETEMLKVRAFKKIWK